MNRTACCARRESSALGSEHDGILELPPSLALNLDLRQALDLDDAALEVNATPNRGDCMSVFGIARDYAAAHERRYLDYAVTPMVARLTAVFPASIEAAEACPQFSSRVIRGDRWPGAIALVDERAAAARGASAAFPLSSM